MPPPVVAQMAGPSPGCYPQVCLRAERLKAAGTNLTRHGRVLTRPSAPVKACAVLARQLAGSSPAMTDKAWLPGHLPGDCRRLALMHHAEQSCLQRGIRLQRLGAALLGDAAIHQHIGPIDDRQHGLRMMLDDDHADAAAQPHQRVHHFLDDSRRQTFEWFVEQDRRAPAPSARGRWPASGVRRPTGSRLSTVAGCAAWETA